MNNALQLNGRVFFEFEILAVTGLAIGGSDTGIEIGGVDRAVIRDSLTNRPYIPGSSLKGKMRSLAEKYGQREKNYPRNQRTFHVCLSQLDYATCNVCQVYGIPGEMAFATPTRIIVRDIHLGAQEAARLSQVAHTDLPFTEVKTEVSIDRVTSAAHPRQMERVPAGTIFGPAEMVYSVYSGAGCDPLKDVERLRTVVEGMQLLEDDYLGGLGSRGSGKIRFDQIRLSLRTTKNYLDQPTSLGGPWTLAELIEHLLEVQAKVRAQLGLG